MPKETLNSPKIIEIENYLRSGYPAKQNEVNLVVREAETQAKRDGVVVYEAVTALFIKAEDLAKIVGVVRRPEDIKPEDYLPNVIEAIKKLEKLENIKDKEMALPDEVAMYAKAELTSAKNLSNVMLEISGVHAAKAVKLTGFYMDLKRMPEFYNRYK